jgi:transposase-like protein
VGHGSWKKDRPPILGILGRTSRQLLLKVLHSSRWKHLQKPVLGYTLPGACIYSDDWNGYARLKKHQRQHHTCSHLPGHRVWADDQDGDGIRETHCNGLEGLWTGVRNFLRIFRGVHKDYLQQYAAVFQWAFCIGHNLKQCLGLMLSSTGLGR